MVINLLLLAGVIVLLLGFIAAKLTARKTQRLRGAGIYPQEGQETEADVDRLLLLGHKIDAIKVYRTVHRVDLKQAKEAVEKRQGELGLH